MNFLKPPLCCPSAFLPTKPIFDFSNQPALYFFTDRPNPTRFYQIPILSPRPFQQETILALERSRPSVVLRGSPASFDDFDGITNDLRAPAVAAYIDDHYAFQHAVRGVEIWQRTPESKPLVLARYMKLIRVPSKEEVASAHKDRLIFPAVADLPGAAESKWQSDLVLHNPGDDTLPLLLRYLSLKNKRAALSLPPHSTASFSNVVDSFFGAPGTRGALFIDFPSGHAPLARLTTYDAKRGGRGSLEKPLTKADAASADGPLKELTVVAIGGPERNRISLGVFSIGNEPAAFRISARGSTGEQIGRVVKGSTEELGGYVLADLAAALDTPIDSSVSIEVTMIRGQAVAYATTVDVNNGDTDVITATPR